MNTSNPMFFLFDVIRRLMSFLDQTQVMGVSLLMWSISFILVGMVVSVFWKGARG